MNLVMMLASSAMQQMGKLVNPVTQKRKCTWRAPGHDRPADHDPDEDEGNLDAEEEKI